jgi:single-strand DNA-binding protein
MARTRFTIAVNRSYKDPQGTRQDEVTYVPIVTWGPQAENCANYLSKGRSVAVEGRLRIDTFETPEGERRKVIEVVANSVQFLGGTRQETAETVLDPSNDIASEPPKSDQKQQENKEIPPF